MFEDVYFYISNMLKDVLIFYYKFDIDDVYCSYTLNFENNIYDK